MQKGGCQTFFLAEGLLGPFWANCCEIFLHLGQKMGFLHPWPWGRGWMFGPLTSFFFFCPCATWLEACIIFWRDILATSRGMELWENQNTVRLGVLKDSVFPNFGLQTFFFASFQDAFNFVATDKHGPINGHSFAPDFGGYQSLQIWCSLGFVLDCWVFPFSKTSLSRNLGIWFLDQKITTRHFFKAKFLKKI